MGVPPSEDYRAPLTPLIRRLEAGRLFFRRTGPRSDDPNRWEVIGR